MNDNWTLFIKKYKNIYFTKDAFEDLCKEFLDVHYTGKNILSNHELEKAKTGKLYVIFLAKWFTENLSNSRKSQIRKEFAKFLEIKKQKNLKIYRWVVCLPHTLDNEEMKWWLNWREKQYKENGVNIDLFDGDFIVENAKRYDLFDKWFLEENQTEKENKKTIDKQEENNDIEIEIIAPLTDDETEKNELKQEENENTETNTKLTDTPLTNDETEKNELKQEEKEDTETNTKLTDTHLTDNETEKNELKQEENENTETNTKLTDTHLTDDETEKKEETTVKTSKTKQTQLIQKIDYGKKIEELPFKYDDLKKQYLKIKAEHLDKLSNKEKKALQELNPDQNYYKIFDDENYKIEDKDKRLFFNASAAKVHKDYDKALFLFEHIKNKKHYTKNLINKNKQIYEEIKDLQKKLQALLYELEGDIYQVKAMTEKQKDDDEIDRKKIEQYYEKAAEKYEQAYKIYSKDKTFNAKYFEFVGDLKLDKEEYAEAYKFFDKALEYKKTQELKIKKEYADKLKKAQKADKKPFFYLYTPIVAWWKYSKALKIFDKKLNKKQDKNYKKDHIKKVEAKYQKTFSESITIISSLILILLLFITFKDNLLQAANTSKEKDTKAMIKNADKIIYTIANQKNYDNIHLIDTAIVLYSTVLKTHPYDTIIKKNLILAKKIKENYIATAQKNINAKPSIYFMPMRSPSEGLQLFKYIYDPNHPSKGKYGYVDKNRKIVIPPFYDFDPNKMYDGKENFHNGKAIVMLKTSNGKKIFLLIDKHNKLIKKVIDF